MSRTGAILETLKELGSVLADCQVVVMTVGAALVAGSWAGISHVFSLMMAAALPAVSMPAATPSFHCLMQIAHCLP